MNPRTLSRAELAVFAKAAAVAIAAGKVSGFTPEQNLAFSTAIDDKAGSLTTADNNAVAAASDYHETTNFAQTERLDLLGLLSAFKYAMRGINANEAEYAAIGFKPPANPSRVTPNRPTALNATGQSNDINILKFKGNNTPGSVNYILEAHSGEEIGWFIIGTTTKRTFTHKGVLPGQAYLYRVRAQAASGESSAWSDTASVYYRGKGPVSEK